MFDKFLLTSAFVLFVLLMWDFASVKHPPPIKRTPQSIERKEEKKNPSEKAIDKVIKALYL